MRARNLLFTIGLGAVALGLGGWLVARGQPEVETAAVTRGPAVAAVYATGTVEPVTWAKVAPTMTARIVDLYVRDGAAVKAGDNLVKFDDREAQHRLAEHEARARYWREELNRTTTLAERGFATRDQRERAQMELQQAEAAIGQARQRLTDLTLLAPMDGIVLRQDGEVGEVVDSKQVILWIGQPRPLRITAEVDEEDIPRVRTGQRALIKADAFPGRVLEGEVAEITPKGDPVNKNYRVRIGLPHDTPLHIGMTTEVNVVVAERAEALLVPRGAVRLGADRAGEAFVVADGIARRVAVRVGIEGRGAVEILEGLSPGQRVIVNPPPGLADGARVRAHPAAAAAAATARP